MRSRLPSRRCTWHRLLSLALTVGLLASLCVSVVQAESEPEEALAAAGAPTVDSISPTSVIAGGSGDVIVTLLGSGFADGSTGQHKCSSCSSYENRSTTFLGPTQLGVRVTAPDTVVSNVGYASIRVRNSLWPYYSNETTFVVNAPPVTVSVPQVGDHGYPWAYVPVDSPAGTIEVWLWGITQTATLTATVSRTHPDVLPSGFTLLPTYYDIQTDALFTSTAEIRLPYAQTEVDDAIIPELSLRVLQYRNGAWHDVTSNLDTTNDVIFGEVEEFVPVCQAPCDSPQFVGGFYYVPSCAVSINNGATYINDPDVELFTNTPEAGDMLVANDGGFVGESWREYKSKLAWTLADVGDIGDQIVTLQVYVKFRVDEGQPLCSDNAASDSIIYDPLPPIIGSLTALRTGSAGLQAAGRLVTLRLSAADQPAGTGTKGEAGSGLAEMRLSTDPSFFGVSWQLFSETAEIVAEPGQTIYAQVRDGAGNVSGMVASTDQFVVFLPINLR